MRLVRLIFDGLPGPPVLTIFVVTVLQTSLLTECKVSYRSVPQEPGKHSSTYVSTQLWHVSLPSMLVVRVVKRAFFCFYVFTVFLICNFLLFFFFSFFSLFPPLLKPKPFFFNVFLSLFLNISPFSAFTF